MVTARCTDCKKEYELEKGQKISDFQCECGGKLRRVFPKVAQPNKSKKKKEEAKLDKCPLCKHEISSIATTCPNCGHPTKRDVGIIWILIALLLPFVGVLAGVYFAVKERSGGFAVISFSVLGFLLYYGTLFYL